MPLPDWLKQGDPKQPTPSPRKPPEADDRPMSGGPELQDLQVDFEPEPAEAKAPQSPPAGKPPAAAKPTTPRPASTKPKQPEPADIDGDQVLDMLAAIDEKLAQLGGPVQDEPGLDDDRPTMAELEERERELHAMRKRVQELEAQVEAAGRASDEGSQDLGRKLSEAQAEIEDLVRQAESTHAELANKDEQLEAASQRIATLEQQLDQRAAAPAAPAAAAAAGGEGGASTALIERQREQIERLTEQLAEYQVDASPAEIQERDARIAELEEQIEILRGEGGGAKPGVSKLVAGLGGALKREKKEGRPAAGSGAIDALERRIEELAAEREVLKARVEQLEPGGSGAGGGDVAALQQRVAELESELASGGSLDVDDATRVLQKQLAEAKANARQAEIKARDAEQLHDEVTKLRQALGARRRGSAAASMSSSGRERTVVIFSCLVGLAIVAMIVSGLAANKLFPAVVSASVNLEAKKPSGGVVTDEDVVKWEQWHRAMLKENDLHQKIAKRLEDQRIDEYATPEAVAERLEKDLSIDSPRTGVLTLTLAGTDRGDLGTILDTVATTLALESSHSIGKRSDGSIAVVRGERQESGRIRYATYNPRPIKDRRLVSGSVMFVFILAFFVVVMSRIYQGVRSTREVMEEDPYDSVAREI